MFILPPDRYFAHFRRLNIYLKNDYRPSLPLSLPLPALSHFKNAETKTWVV